MEETLWGDSEDDTTCLDVLVQYELKMPPARVKKSPKFTEVKLKEIVNQYSDVRWKEQGFWIFHFDLAKWEEAWKSLQKLYLDKKLEGVIRICLANEERNNSKAMYCFVGPPTNATRCLETGQLVIKSLNYQRQICHQEFSSYVYYKLKNGSQYLHKLSF